MENSLGGFASHSQDYDVAIIFDEEKGLYAIPFYETFNKIFVSEEAGHQKPEKEYFDYVISNIPEKDRTKMLIVGDSQSSDILAGINSDIDTCWYNPKGNKAKYSSKFVISTLLELKELL